jgi:hypothetical protein
MIISLFSCRKDKVQEPVIEEPTKWELISGEYKVYDTLGEYLFDMGIEHFQKEDSVSDDIRDYFRFVNFDNEFVFDKSQYSKPSNYYGSQLYVELGSHDTLFDSDGNRWKFFGVLEEGYNKFQEDTIFLKFKKTNHYCPIKHF